MILRWFEIIMFILIAWMAISQIMVPSIMGRPWFPDKNGSS